MHVRDTRGPGGRPKADRGLRDKVRRDLAELPALYKHCESLLVSYPPAFAQKVAGGGTTGLFLDERVTDARRDIVAVLASWSGLVADERGVTKPGRRDATELSAFLAIHMDWLLAHPAGSCFADELLAVAAAAREVSRTGPLPAIELGPCVEEGCDKPMTATRPASGAASAFEVRCAAGHVWRPCQWLQLAPAQGPVWGACGRTDEPRQRRAAGTAAGSRRTVPTELAAVAAGVSVATIRSWANRGKLSRYGTPGRAEYDLEELMDMMAGKNGRGAARNKAS